MMAPKTYAELRGLTDEQLVELYDANTQNVVIGLNYLRQELALREQAAQTQAMLRHTVAVKRLTWWIAAMTLVVTVATIVNVALELRG